VPGKVYLGSDWSGIESGKWGVGTGSENAEWFCSGRPAVGNSKSNCSAVAFPYTQFIEMAFNGVFSAALLGQEIV